MRYEIRPLDENGEPIDEIIATINNAISANLFAADNSGLRPFGLGVVDTETGAIDVGFGFGVPSHALDE